MSKREYRRFRDRAIVSEAEATDANGTVRNGYGPVFNIMLMDGTPPADVLTDAALALYDSAEGKAILAHARMKHDTAHAYHGNAAPEFTPEMGAKAIHDAVAAKTANAARDAALPSQATDAGIRALAARAEMLRDMTGRQ